MQQEHLVDLTDTVQAVENTLLKAHWLCQDICDQYFRYSNLSYDKVKEQQGFIIWEYRHFAAYAYIIQDYLQQAETLLSVASGQLCDYPHNHSGKNRGLTPLGKVAEE